MTQSESISNTVYVPIPEGVLLAATHLVFERYGEVLGVDCAPHDPFKAAVVFFDVRSAARAVESLGNSYCTLGPQMGSRSVRLPGDANFEADDLAGVASAEALDDGSYVLEFYDVRDAARYGSKAAAVQAEATRDDDAPPGLEIQESAEDDDEAAAAARPSPPSGLSPRSETVATLGGAGLPPGLPMPPGLEDEPVAAFEDTQVVQVCVSGFPNKLLTRVMFEAILQQAGLANDIVDFSVQRGGKSRGEATMFCSSEEAAEQCVLHFQTCQWDDAVVARIVEDEEAAAKRQERLAEWTAGWHDCGGFDCTSMWVTDLGAGWARDTSDATIWGLSADALEWVPVESSTYTAEAATFTVEALDFAPTVAGTGTGTAEMTPATRAAGTASGRGSNRQKKVRSASSETSTEVSESEDVGMGARAGAARAFGAVAAH